MDNSFAPSGEAQCGNEALHFEWFHVSGDLDDFIFYGEDEPNVSQR